MNTVPASMLVCVVLAFQVLTTASGEQQQHVWQKVEITLESHERYENPYTDVEVWVGLVNRRQHGSRNAAGPVSYDSIRRKLNEG